MPTAFFEAHSQLEEYSSNIRRGQRLSKDIQLLFLNISAERSARLLNLLRSDRLSPRGRNVDSIDHLLEALSERSWDLIVLAEGDASGTYTLKQGLRERRRDIPVIQLVPTLDTETLTNGLEQQADCVIPEDNDTLALAWIQRELTNLQTRKNLQKAQIYVSDCEDNIRQLITDSSLAILLCQDDKISYANGSLLDFLGYVEAEDLTGKAFNSIISKGNRREFNNLLRTFENSDSLEYCINLPVEREDRSELNCRIVLKKIQLDNTLTLQATLHAKSILSENILHDGIDYLSGLYNKKFLAKQLGNAIHKAMDGGHDCNLLYLCLDQFQALDQQHGEDASDQLIRNIAILLQKQINRVHLIAHPEPDSFALLFFDASTDKAMHLAKKLRREIRRCETDFNNQLLQTSCSISVAPITDNSPGKDELLQQAEDTARQLSTSKGDAIGLVAQQLEKPSQNNNKLTEKLWVLVHEGSMQLLFQPIVEMSHTPGGAPLYEVLLRFLDGRKRALSPSGIMQRITDPALKIAIDHWVIEQSLIALKQQSPAGAQPRLAISLSPQTMLDPGTLIWLSEKLGEYQVPASSLIFQISEINIGLDIDNIRQFTQELNKMHCQVCIKHFGSAPNSSDITKRIKPHFIKLDGSFIRDLQGDSSHDTNFSRTVERLKNQDKQVIAPMVEDTKVMCKLWQAGVDYIQGFYLQPPREAMDYDFFEGSS